jgi:dimethylaniline monooxygenase (N-oxide forming)
MQEVPKDATARPRASRAASAGGQRRPRVCVIGAGTSGLVALKALTDRGIDCVGYDQSDRVGGLWVFRNANGRGGAYRSLHINTSRERMQLRDHPMPASYPDYPGHEQIASYLAGFAERFDLTRNIRFRTTVERVEPAEEGGYFVTLGSAERAQFDAVVVANGHHFEPHLPERRGEFSGVELHSHRYVDPSEPFALAGKRVAVVGFGNSAVDIACELGRDPATRVFLSVRRGAWVLPKYVLGRPLDQVSKSRPLVPRQLSRRVAESWYRLAVGDPRRFGLPLPDHRLGDAHPTVSSDLFTMLGSGQVVAKPALVSRAGRRVRFADDSEEELDAIVYATGYKISFPFFADAFLAAPNNELPLYLRIFHSQHQGLYFIGFCQPLGPIMPIAEAQAKLVAAHLAGEYCLPRSSIMERACADERARMRRRFGDSPRHTMQVDFDDYLALLERERERSGSGA